MSDDEVLLGEVTDPDGRLVALPAHIWGEKVWRDHPELSGQLEAVLDTVGGPAHLEPDPREDPRRYYRRGVGPSRWLLVIVRSEQEPAWIHHRPGDFKGTPGDGIHEGADRTVDLRSRRLRRRGRLLYLHVGEPVEAEGEETPEGHAVRFEPGTQRVVGLTLINARSRCLTARGA